MRTFVNIFIVTLVYVFSGHLIKSPTPKVSLYNSYEIKSPDKFSDYVLGGHSPGIGSGLTLASEKNDREKEFLSIADSGSFLINKSGNRTPFAGKISLKDEAAQITAVIPMTGLSDGFDGEALALEEGANVWLADEEGPSIVRYNLALGRPLSVYSPGKGLPDVLKHKMHNRGIEALAVMPGGKIVFALQSVLNVDGKSLDTAKHIRILKFDPKTQKVETFIYPIDIELYALASEVKIGGLTPINSHKALLIEQGPSIAGDYINRIVKIDFSLAGVLDDNLGELELEGKSGGLFGIRSLEPEVVFNLRDYAWKHRKAEGIALSERGRTLYIINDIDTKIGQAIEPQQDPLKVYLWEFRLTNSFKVSVFVDIAYKIAPGLLSLIAMMILFRRKKSSRFG